MRNKTLTRIIIATLLCALLVNAGRATRVFALAQPIDPVEPIYETEVIALYEYVSENLEQNVPQLDIFFLLTGALAVAQLGAQDALLESPYPNESSVKEWLINCGLQLYNAVIGLVPSGDYYMGIPSIGMETRIKGIPRQTIKALVAQMMGNAVVARNYASVDDFLNDENRPKMPFDASTQKSINAIWQLQGGPYQWQFNADPFTDTWYNPTIPTNLISQYNSILNTYSNPLKCNATYGSDFTYSFGNVYIDCPYENVSLFIKTDENRIFLCNSSGQALSDVSVKYLSVVVGDYARIESGTRTLDFSDYSYSNNDLPLVNIVNSLFANSYPLANVEMFNAATNWFYGIPLLSQLVGDRVYAGTNWINKQQLYNIQNLNISEDMNDYYRESDRDLFFDIKELIQNLVNKTSIWDFFLDHLFDIDGNLIIPNFPTFSVDLTPITELLAPPIPVNMNDIALYTDNDYLEEVKERSRKFGETIGQYFVFWHNSDPVTVYVIFGSFIVILVGLFVGTWRHS